MFQDTNLDDDSELEASLIGSSIESSRKKQIKKYRIIILYLSIIATGFLIVLICSAVIGFWCRVPLTKLSGTPKSSVSFIHMSDLHLDNYYDPKLSDKSFCRRVDPKFKIPVKNASYMAPYGRVNCDAPKTLIESAMQKAMNITLRNNEIKFLLFTGDQSAHRMEKYFTSGTPGDRVLASMRSVSDLVQKYLPSLPIIPTFGNNDLPGDYNLPPNSTYYSKVLKIWKPLMLKKCEGCAYQMVNENELSQTFLRGGYFKAHLRVKDHNILIISLNTNYWTMNCYSPERTTPSNAFLTADTQLNWLKNELKSAVEEKRSAILIGHVPPGIDPYGGHPIWFKNYTKEYLKLVTETYKDTIIAQIYGHFHKDEFKIQTYKEYDSKSDESTMNNFILFGPGVTPVYKNNPSFRVLQIDQNDGKLLDYEQFYMDIVMATEFGTPSWAFDYKFSVEYGLRPVSKDMMKFAARLIDPADQSKTWNKYIRHRQVNYQSRSYSRFQLYCALRHTSEAEYKKCISTYKVPGG